MANVASLKIRLPADDRELELSGRDAWALWSLIEAGPSGCTPLTHVGPRWSAYVFNLRKRGIDVETKHETHGGAYSGHHANYVLRSPVEVVSVEYAA